MTHDSIFSVFPRKNSPIIGHQSQPPEAPPISVVEVEVSSPAKSGVKVGMVLVTVFSETGAPSWAMSQKIINL